MKKIVNMRSSANKVKGQGVGSCYDEHFALVQKHLSDCFEIHENDKVRADITHYHTVDFKHYVERLTSGKKSASVCFVHFLPETVDNSIKLPWLARVVFYEYLKTFYNSMDYLVAVNPRTIQQIQKAGIKKPKLCYIPNFVSESNFHELSKYERSTVRHALDIDDDKFVVLGVGQLQTRKGVFDFFETARRMPDIQFVWAGGFSFGRITDGYDEIKKVVDNPPANVKFLGIIDRSKMNQIYNICDLMFLPSYDELFPMSILEAMSCRKPILLRDIPVYDNILTGAYLKADSAEGFCERIRLLADDSAAYAEWVENAWQCHLKYNEDSISKMWRRLYECAACGAVFDWQAKTTSQRSGLYHDVY